MLTYSNSSRTNLGVESSHEMTMRRNQPVAAPVAPVYRPPYQHHNQPPRPRQSFRPPPGIMPGRPNQNMNMGMGMGMGMGDQMSMPSNGVGMGIPYGGPSGPAVLGGLGGPGAGHMQARPNFNAVPHSISNSNDRNRMRMDPSIPNSTHHIHTYQPTVWTEIDSAAQSQSSKRPHRAVCPRWPICQSPRTGGKGQSARTSIHLAPIGPIGTFGTSTIAVQQCPSPGLQ